MIRVGEARIIKCAAAGEILLGLGADKNVLWNKYEGSGQMDWIPFRARTRFIRKIEGFACSKAWPVYQAGLTILHLAVLPHDLRPSASQDLLPSRLVPSCMLAEHIYSSLYTVCRTTNMHYLMVLVVPAICNALVSLQEGPL